MIDHFAWITLKFPKFAFEGNSRNPFETKSLPRNGLFVKF